MLLVDVVQLRLLFDIFSVLDFSCFLWVALVCQELADPKVRKRYTLSRLQSFPPGLDSLYGRMIEHIRNSEDDGLCKEILAISSVVY